MPHSTPFPKPEAVIARRNYRLKRAVRVWASEVAGKPEPDPAADDEVLLNSAKVRAMFGGVSDMWIHRRRFPEQAANASRKRRIAEAAATSVAEDEAAA